MIATKRMSTLAGSSPTMQGFGRDIAQYKEESEKEQVDEVRTRVSPLLPPLSPSPADARTLTWANRAQDRNVMHYDGGSDDSKEELKKPESEGLAQKMQNMSV